MSICCVVCGLWYHTEGRDTLDICPPCHEMNFSGAQPALDVPLRDPSAREALEAFAASDHQLTPRRQQAMARLAAEWRRQAQEDES